MSSQKTRPKHNYSSAAPHAHTLQGQLTLMCSQVPVLWVAISLRRLAAISAGAIASVCDGCKKLIWDPLLPQFSNLGDPLAGSLPASHSRKPAQMARAPERHATAVRAMGRNPPVLLRMSDTGTCFHALGTTQSAMTRSHITAKQLHHDAGRRSKS